MNTKPYHAPLIVTVLLMIALFLASVQVASANHTAVPVLAYAAESSGETNSLTKVYLEPTEGSQLIDILPPGQQIQILGLSENGAWIAMGKKDQSALAGWVSGSNVNENLIIGSTRSLVQMYGQPGSFSKVDNVLPPGAKVLVLGHSPDNAWIAIAHPGGAQATINWVEASSLKLPDVFATTSSLTMLYLKPDSKSKITTVLPPAQKVLLTGRNSQSTWFAVTDIQEKRFIGWAQGSDLNANSDRATLPVIPAQ